MASELVFLPSALKEWRRLGGNVRLQFKAKLTERSQEPRMSSAKLSGSSDRYKIKLRAAGYRLVYSVDGDRLVVTVIAAGRRDGGAVYDTAERR